MIRTDDKQPRKPSLSDGKPAANEVAPPEIAPVGHKKPAREFGGPEGPEPTRYGDWERNGRVSDF